MNRIKIAEDVYICISIAVSDNKDYYPDEACITLETEAGEVIQDIALVRQGEQERSVECVVWSDANNEDYTYKFNIGIYNYEEA